MSVRRKMETDMIEEMRRKVILNGGSTASERRADLWKTICLRISTKMIENIEDDLKNRPGMSRNAWILEAISEKVNHDQR